VWSGGSDWISHHIPMFPGIFYATGFSSYPVFNAPEPESLMSISATHMTLNESDTSELIT